MITDHSRNLQLQPKDFSFYSKFNSILDYKFNLFVKSICTKLIDIIKNNLSEIKKLKNTFYKKSDGSHVSEGDLLIQKLLQDEILKSKLVKKISETTGQQIKKEQLEVIDHEK